MMEILGLPPPELIQISTRKHLFFDSEGSPKIKTNSRGKRRIPGTRVLKNLLKGADNEFFQLIQGCLIWHPSYRLKPSDALNNQWFQENNNDSRGGIPYKHKKISLEDITKHVPNLQKFIAHRSQISIT